MFELIELYQPSNGTEGDIFMSEFCFKCSKFPHDSDAKNQCAIFGKSLIYDTKDKEYPHQWRIESGKPTCTAFKDREEANAERRESRKPRKRYFENLDLFKVEK